MKKKFLGTDYHLTLITIVNYRKKLLELYNLFPFENHPLWVGVINHDLTYEQVIKAEVQHYLRTKQGKDLRWDALSLARIESQEIFEVLIKTCIEECTEDETGPSHLDLIKRLILEGGVKEEDLERVKVTPGNAAAIALYKDITKRGSACHMLGAGVVEHFYSMLSPKIYHAYTNYYGMSESQAETYNIHGSLDETHSERAFGILDVAIKKHGWEEIYMAVRDAFVATSLHYDGMLQGATQKIEYWDGKK